VILTFPSLASSVSFMISMFVLMSWEKMTSWHTYTKAHVEVNKLTAWRINPTRENYAKLSPAYRPTQLQVSVTHPTIIDWIPFPALRDKLILYHAGNPRLDDIVCEIGNSYVVETDLSTLISGIGSVKCYVGVWDLVRAISSENKNVALRSDVSGNFPADLSFSEESPLDEHCRRSSIEDIILEEQSTEKLPASGIEALFASKVLALQAFRLLGMDRGACTFRLDPTIFEKHPELYDCKADLIAKGIPIRPPHWESVPAPIPLNKSLLNRYGEMTKLDHFPADSFKRNATIPVC
jgi:hypothetical protein